MARCEQGYLCDVCGDEVHSIRESDLYLRFVIGEVSASQLLSRPERHIRCNPVQAQFIDAQGFEPVVVDGPFDRRLMDQDSAAARTSLLSQGWRRLQELADLPAPIPLADYPLQRVERRSQLPAVGESQKD